MPLIYTFSKPFTTYNVNVRTYNVNAIATNTTLCQNFIGMLLSLSVIHHLRLHADAFAMLDHATSSR